MPCKRSRASRPAAAAHASGGYVQDAESGEYGGFYHWESPEAFAEYRESELRASIAAAYQAEGEPRVEVCRVIEPLRV